MIREKVIIKKEPNCYTWATRAHGAFNHSNKEWVIAYMERHNYDYKFENENSTVNRSFFKQLEERNNTLY